MKASSNLVLLVTINVMEHLIKVSTPSKVLQLDYFDGFIS